MKHDTENTLTDERLNNWVGKQNRIKQEHRQNGGRDWPKNNNKFAMIPVMKNLQFYLSSRAKNVYYLFLI